MDWTPIVSDCSLSSIFSALQSFTLYENQQDPKRSLVLNEFPAAPFDLSRFSGGKLSIPQKWMAR
jgi:hypothetical protein